LQSTIHHLNTFLLVGSGNDRAVDRIGNDRRTVWAGAMTEEKTGQDIQSDIGAGDADEFAAAHDRISHKDYRIAGVWIDRRLGDNQRTRLLCRLVAWQGSYIQR
jgi:hypothetical protein